MILDSVLLIAVETLFVVVSGFFLIFYVRKLRSTIIQEKVAGEIVSSIVTSLEKKIHEKDDRIGDLLFRLDLLEAKMLSSTIKQSKVERGMSKAHSDISSIPISNDITTTEMTVLQVLQNGVRTAKEIQTELGKSREHVTRLMKQLFEKGYVSRNQDDRPFIYNLTDAGRDLIIGSKRL